MATTALFHHRNSLAHFSMRFEISKYENVVSQVAHINRRLHGAAHQSHLRQNKQGDHSTIIQVGQKFMQMESEKLLAWHGDRKSTRLNSSHSQNSYAVFCL